MRMSRFLSQWRPDILHAHTSKAHTHLWLTRKLLKRAPPLVVSRRVTFPVSRGIWGYLKYRTGVAHYVPISQAAARTLRDVNVSEEMMTVVPSGVDVESFEQSQADENLLGRWGIERGNFVIGTVAAFEKEKGYNVLLGAARKVIGECPECRFILLGAGRLRRSFETSIEHMELGGKIIIDGVSASLERILPLFDCYVLSSRDEGLSTALIAALASGLPVIASDVGGIPEVLSSGCGILVPPDDAEGLAAAILTLVRDDGLRRMLALRGRRRAWEFDIGKTVERTLEVYEHVLGQRF